jgi:high-affinity Fe2+/Pb2+ permease
MSDDVSTTSKKTLVQEAKLQSKAIAQIEIWARLACSLLALGVLLVWWSIQSAGSLWILVVGLLLAVIFGITSAVLKVGITRAKVNVKHILDAAGIDLNSFNAKNAKRSS